MVVALQGPAEVLERAVHAVEGATPSDPEVAADRVYEVESSGGGQYVLRCEGSSFTGELSPADDIVQAIREDMVAFVAEHARAHAFVHAGAVGWRGGAILVPGRSGTGKSSLVASLIRAGATYYSDEYAPLDQQGLVHPYARSLELREPVGSGAISAASLGAEVGSEPLPVAVILRTAHLAGATWRPEVRPTGEGVLALLENAVAARTRPEFVLPILRRAAVRATVLAGSRGDADETARAILDWMN